MKEQNNLKYSENFLRILENYTNHDFRYNLLIDYMSLLQKLNSKINLYSRKISLENFETNIIDVIGFAMILEKNISDREDYYIYDIGAGNGLLGVITSILLSAYKNIEFIMIERDLNKCIFLNEVILRLNLLNIKTQISNLTSKISHINNELCENDRVNVFMSKAFSSLKEIIKIVKINCTKQNLITIYSLKDNKSVAKEIDNIEKTEYKLSHKILKNPIVQHYSVIVTEYLK